RPVQGAVHARSVVPGCPRSSEYKEATPEVSAPATTCLELAGDTGLLGVPERPNGPWPVVGVVYGSVHRTPGGYTAITWAAVLNTDTMTWLNRIPIEVTRHSAGQSTSEVLAREPVPTGALRLTGGTTQRTVTVPCELLWCKVTPELVLRSFP